MGNKKLIQIAVLNCSKTWNTIIEQEGFLCQKIISAKDSIDYPLTLLLDDVNQKVDTILDVAREGGFFVLNPAMASKIFNLTTKQEQCKYWKCDFRNLKISDKVIDIPFRITFTNKSEEWNEIDKDSGILIRYWGKGGFIVLPFDLENWLKNKKTIRKRFYAERKELPSERVANFSNSPIRKIFSAVIEYFFTEFSLPLVKKWYFPGLKKNLFLYRIDTDFCSIDQANNLKNLLNKYNLKATWFIDTINDDRVKQVYSQLGEHEVGIHCYHHIITKDKMQIKNDIIASKQICKKHGIKPVGYAAPLGEWYSELSEVLEDESFSYSSEFAFDFDNFPSYPIIDNKFNSVLQIPIHPVSPGRLRRSHFTEDEKVEYFKSVIFEKMMEDEVMAIYHHPAHEMLEMTEKIFQYIKNENIPNLTFRDYCEFYKRRLDFTPGAFWQGNKILMDYDISYEDVVLCIKVNGKTALTKYREVIDLDALSFDEKLNYFKTGERERIYKFDWRDLLYDYESAKGRKRFERRLIECGYF
jgi:peptidoglycan/xylan/chitin deacetylase (PgdA/CDA1 family)